MAGISTHKAFGLTIRESANDGSDFTNPDADYRRLFLGEDGVLHLKDSAGTVTTPGSGLTDPMTTRGDIIIRNSSNVTARLARGSASTVLTSDGTDVAWASPAAAPPDTYETFLSADVTAVSAATWYSHTSLTLTPPTGDYLAIGHLSMTSASASITYLSAMIATGGSLTSNALSGHTGKAQGSTYNPASNAGGQVSITVMAKVTGDGSTPVRLAGLDVRGSSDGVLVTTAISSGIANKASSLVLIKVTSV